ncbi:MAG: sialate O-acetylesterase [Planctomycetota bacterium]
MPRSMTPVFVLLALIVLPSNHSVAVAKEQAPSVDVYILSGQSNMVGSGRYDELELADKWASEAFIFSKGKTDWDEMRPDTGLRDWKRFGPEIGFAQTLRAKSDINIIYLVKFALSGQPLDAGWANAGAKGDGWAGPEPGLNRKTFYPGESPDDPNIGLHYKRLHAHVTAAFKNLKDQGMAPRLRGIVWMQGEADAKHEVSAGRYDRSLALLKQRIEQDFAEGTDVPFIFGQVLAHEPALERFTHRDLIRKRMADADWNSGTKHAIDNVWMVPTEGMELLKDTVHYSTKGQLALGRAFGDKMLEAHRKAKQDAQ